MTGELAAHNLLRDEISTRVDLNARRSRLPTLESMQLYFTPIKGEEQSNWTQTGQRSPIEITCTENVTGALL